ncbi:MAG: hypothetical protein V1746_00510 [bacterium]
MSRKKILIFTASFGHGHNAAAYNLQAGIERIAQNRAEVKVLDIFTSPLSKFWRKLYFHVIDKTPSLWKGFYYILHHTRLFQSSLWMFQSCAQQLKTLLLQEQPDIVCCTYPLYTHFFQLLRRRGQLPPFREITIITDSISINSLWYRGGSELLIVPNEDTARVLQQASVPNEKIRPLGFPLQLDFTFPEKTLPPPSSETGVSILYIVSSHKHRAKKALLEFLKHPNWNITFLTNRDRRLLQQLARLAKGNEHRIHLIEWAKTMPRLLMNHHFVITKSGGAIVQEAIAAKCPMIINHIVPSHEEGNFILLQQNHCGAMAQQPREIAACIESALDDNARLWHAWQNNMAKLAKPDSSLKIAEFLLSL